MEPKTETMIFRTKADGAPKVSPAKYFFGNCRDAIDAVSAFESSITYDAQYDIRMSRNDTWIVQVRDHMNQELGFLAPA